MTGQAVIANQPEGLRAGTSLAAADVVLVSERSSRSPRRRTLRERLFAEPHRFDPLQAMRLLELGRPRAAADHLNDNETFSVTSAQTLAMLASPLQGADIDTAGRPRLRIGFLGLTGPLGVLPQSYTETVIRATRARNRAVAAFLDIFNQRLAGLFLRASEKYRIAPAHQHRLSGRDLTQPREPIVDALRAVAGYGTPGLVGRSSLRDETIVYFSGLLAQRNRSATGLEGMLRDVLGAAVRVEQFVGHWIPVPPQDQSRLDGAAAAFARLDHDAMVGSRTWDAQGMFRIVVGPVRHAQMQALMPGGPALRELVDLVRAYVGPELGFDVQVILHRDDIPDLRLDDADRPRLGWNSWAKSLPALADADDILLNPDLVLSFIARERSTT